MVVVLVDIGLLTHTHLVSESSNGTLTGEVGLGY
tara:strand:+ start:310 stop:411 length:102 start_codon:yes stop_codon:yes gene_type:complete